MAFTSDSRPSKTMPTLVYSMLLATGVVSPVPPPPVTSPVTVTRVRGGGEAMVGPVREKVGMKVGEKGWERGWER